MFDSKLDMESLATNCMCKTLNNEISKIYQYFTFPISSNISEILYNDLLTTNQYLPPAMCSILLEELFTMI